MVVTVMTMMRMMMAMRVMVMVLMMTMMTMGFNWVWFRSHASESGTGGVAPQFGTEVPKSHGALRGTEVPKGCRDIICQPAHRS